MKNIICILIVIFFALNGNTQSNYYAQTINNTAIPISDSAKCVVIYYNSGGCSLCMKVLLSYCRDITHENPNTQLVVMIEGHACDIIGLRSNTSHVQTYFTNEISKIVYDINNGKRKTYAKSHHISNYPSLLLINTQKNKCKYISYKEIFNSSDNVEISKYAQSKMHDFLTNKSK